MLAIRGFPSMNGVAPHPAPKSRVSCGGGTGGHFRASRWRPPRVARSFARGRRVPTGAGESTAAVAFALGGARGVLVRERKVPSPEAQKTKSLRARIRFGNGFRKRAHHARAADHSLPIWSVCAGQIEPPMDPIRLAGCTFGHFSVAATGARPGGCSWRWRARETSPAPPPWPGGV